jgi:hypothetical protein
MITADRILVLRRHTATLASDVLAMRERLDSPLHHVPAYGRALAHIADALSQLELAATQLDALSTDDQTGAE